MGLNQQAGEGWKNDPVKGKSVCNAWSCHMFIELSVRLEVVRDGPRELG